jgi:hypothetical protein
MNLTAQPPFTSALKLQPLSWISRCSSYAQLLEPAAPTISSCARPNLLLWPLTISFERALHPSIVADGCLAALKSP